MLYTTLTFMATTLLPPDAVEDPYCRWSSRI
jgi:hypothetical protein